MNKNFHIKIFLHYMKPKFVFFIITWEDLNFASPYKYIYIIKKKKKKKRGILLVSYLIHIYELHFAFFFLQENMM